MTRISVKDAIAEQRALIRDLRATTPVDAAAIAVAESRIKRWRKIGKPPTPKHARRVAAVRDTLETLLKPYLKPGTNSTVWTLAAESVVSLFDQQRKAVNSRHNKPGASRDKGEAIRAAWATGKWKSKDACATDHGPKVGLGFAAARRHLRGA